MSMAVEGDGEAPKHVQRSVQQLRESLVGLRQDLDSLFKVRRRIVSNRHELLEHYLQVGCEKFPNDMQAYGEAHGVGALSSSAPAPSVANGMPKASSSLNQGAVSRGSSSSAAQHVGGESKPGAPSSLGSIEPAASQASPPSPDDCKALVLDFLQTAAASESMSEVAQRVRPDTISEVCVGDVVGGSCLVSVRYKDQLRPASDGMSCQEFLLERSGDNHHWVVQPPSSMKDGSKIMGLSIAGTPPPSPPTPSRSARGSRLASRMSETLQLTQLVEEETEEISPRKIPGHERAKQWENPADAAESLRSSIRFGLELSEPSSTPRQVFRDFAGMAGEGLIEREKFADFVARYGGINPREKDVNLLASMLFVELATSVGEEHGVPYDIFCTELHSGVPDAAIRLANRKKALLKKVQAAVRARLAPTCGLSDCKEYILDRVGSEPLKEQAFRELVKELIADPACKDPPEPVALKALWCDLVRDCTIGKREATAEQVATKLLEGADSAPAEASARPVLEEVLVEDADGALSPRTQSGRELAEHDPDPGALLDVARLGISLDRRPALELLKAAVKREDLKDVQDFGSESLSKEEFCTFIAKFAGGQPLIEAGEDRAFQATTTDARAQVLFSEMAIIGPDGKEAVPVDLLLAEVCPDKAPDSRSRVAKAVRLLLQELSTAASVKALPEFEPQHELTEASFREVVRDALPNPEEPLMDLFAMKALWLFLTHHGSGRKATSSSPSGGDRRLSFEELRKALSGDHKDRSSIPLDYSDCESSALELTQDETITPFLSPQSRQQQSNLQAAPNATAVAESSSSIAADQSTVAPPPARQKKAVRVRDNETPQLARAVLHDVFAKISSNMPAAPAETPPTKPDFNKDDQDGAGSAEVAPPLPEVVEDILRHVKEGAVAKAGFSSQQSGTSQVEPITSSAPAATSSSVSKPTREQTAKRDDSDEDWTAVKRVPSRKTKTFAEIEESTGNVYDLLEQFEEEEEEKKAKRRASRSSGMASQLQAPESGRRKSYRMPTMTRQVSMAVSEADSESWQDPGAIDDQLVILARSMEKVRSNHMEVLQSEQQAATSQQEKQEKEVDQKREEEKEEEEEEGEKQAEVKEEEDKEEQPEKVHGEEEAKPKEQDKDESQEQKHPTMDEGVLTKTQAADGAAKRAALIDKIESTPDVARYWAEVAQLMSAGDKALIRGKAMKQLDLLVQAIELDPSYASAFSDLGAVMSADDKCKEVQFLGATWTEKDLYTRAIELDQSCANPYLNLSDIMDDSEVLTIKGEHLSKNELKRRGEALERGELARPEPCGETVLQAATASSGLSSSTPEVTASTHEKPGQSQAHRMGREEIKRRLEELKNAANKSKPRAAEARPTTEDSLKSQLPVKFLTAKKHVGKVEKEYGEMSDEFCDALLELAECAGKMKAHKEERTTLERVLKLQDSLYVGRSEADTEVASKKRATLVALVDVYRALDDEHAEIDALHRLEDMEESTPGEHHHHLHLGQELHHLPAVAEGQHHPATSSLPSMVVPFMQHTAIFKETGIAGQSAMMMTPPRHDPSQGSHGGIENAELVQEASSLLGASSLLSEVAGEEDDSPFKFSAAARNVHNGSASELSGEGRSSAVAQRTQLEAALNSDSDDVD